MGVIVGYAATLGVYFCIYNIFALGLNIQFGYAGILNFTVITFMAIGGYMAGVASLTHEVPSSGIYYILGLGLPWPISMLIGAASAGLLGYLIGLVALRRLRSDYLAIVTLAAGSIIYGLVGNNTKIFDGFEGLVGVPQPFNGVLQLGPNSYSLVFLAFSAVVMAICWLLANRLYRSPLGRTMRAIREDLDVAEAFGKHTYRVRMIAMVLGCVFVGIGGVLTIWYVTALAPAGWGTSETFVIWAALIVGGRGNNTGAVVGSFLVAVLFNEATRFLPAISSMPNLIPEIRNMCIGALVILVLWFRPQGVVPERKARFPEPVKLVGLPDPIPVAGGAVDVDD
ncbi:inner-membrane translocator [Acidimicrobium ferrooxidans DSM 10331]|uniref:Inner-membrane translocator n=1 Tax=Acidimicrobium ferrooxidans (strain DSM 10331 / JCM 15462 / NBRC 103882 / ICP) TaxID=525909 RepID=C7M379_ACIFD|nr:branched-chain amino acid ABC transporter permease [Acidimicrobium ferrooxidans]ACU53473.1 inner-membrane translocator [Acidimicrobium ferrooxidans DSM 10331]